MEQLAVAKEAGLGGANTSQDRGGLQGIIYNVTAQVAKCLPGVPKEVQARVAAVGLVGLGVLSQAEAQIVLSDFSPLQNGAISQRSAVQNASDLTVNGWNIHGNFFSVENNQHDLGTLKTRGNFLRGPDGASTYFSPFDDQIRHLAIFIYQVGHDGKPSAASAPFITLTRGPNDISVSSTGLSDSQGFAFHELSMDVSGTVLNPGSYFLAVASHTGNMGGGSARPNWRVGLAESGSSLVPNLISQDFTNGGEWSTLSRNNIAQTGKFYLDANPVPEPAGLAILGLGAAALASRRRRS